MKNYNHRSLLAPQNRPNRIGLSMDSAPGGSAADDYKVDLSDIWDPIRRGKWIILAVCVLCVAGVTAYTMTLPPVYQASSIVAVESQNPATGVLRIGGGTPELAREIGVLTASMELARRVASELQATAEAVGSAEDFPILVGEEGSELSTEEVADRLSDRMRFIPLTEQSMIQMSATSQDPAEAASIANIYADVYQEFSREESRAGVVAARQFLEEQLEKREEQIRQLENQWEAFAQSNQVVTQGQDGTRLVQEFAGLTAQRDELEFQLENEQHRLEILERQLSQYRPQLGESVFEERAASSLQSQIEALEEDIAQLKAEALPYYINNPELEGNEESVPELAALVRQIEGLEEEKRELTEQLIAQAADDEGGVGTEGSALGRIAELRAQIQEQEFKISQIEAQIVALESRIGVYDSRLAGIPRQTIEREQIDRKLQQAESFYADVAQQLQKTIIAEESELGYVKPVREASVPQFPISPDLQRNILLGLLLGLAFGTGLAFVREASNKRIHRPEDLQENGFSLVGVIPRMDREIKASFQGKDTIDVDGRELSTRLIPLLNPWSPISENYRLVRTNLQHSGYGESLQVVLITSPEPSDGKSVTAANLAITIAQSGRRTLLIDTDLRRPNAHKLLGTPIRPGLAEVLFSDGPVEIQAHATEVEGLHFLPAGVTDGPPAEALGSDRMRELIKLAREKYDAVIIDSPPVLAVSDPLLMATECDATIVVTSADRTDMRALEVTKQTLNAIGVPIAGVIFNRYDAERSGGYGYGYGYRNYNYTSASA